MKLEEAIDLLHGVYLVRGGELTGEDLDAVKRVAAPDPERRPLVLRQTMIPAQLYGILFHAWMVLKEETDRRTGRNLEGGDVV